MPRKHIIPKCLKNFFRSWRVQLGLILATFMLGMAGYFAFYSFKGNKILTNIVIQSLYSTLRLFSASFDAEPLGGEWSWVNYVLETARWLGMMLTGFALLRLISPLLARSRAETEYHAWKRRKKTVMLVGHNRENMQIYRSAAGEDHPLILCDTGCEEACDLRTRNGYRRINTEAMKAVKGMVRRALEKEDTDCTIIVNTGNEERNLELCREIAAQVSDALRPDLEHYRELDNGGTVTPGMLEIEKKIVERLRRLHVSVFGDKRYQEIYLKLQEESAGVLQYTNRYLLNAFAFVFRYPLSRSVPREWIRAGCVDGDVSLNVIMVGFGQGNRSIYSAHRTANQFITDGPDGIPTQKKIRYTVIDRVDPDDNSMNHADFRFERDFREETGNDADAEYLPLPEDPADTEFLRMDLNSRAFYQAVKRILLDTPKSVSHILVCVGDDLANIDVAQKLAAKVREWNAAHVTVFARVKNGTLSPAAAEAGLTPFGDEAENVFSLSMVRRRPVFEMARKRNLMYEMESRGKDDVLRTEDDIALHAEYRWHTMTPRRQYSNIYAMLGLRFKLNLMGMDFERAEAGAGSGREIENNTGYMSIYAAGDHPSFTGKQYKGMDLISYTGGDTEDDFRQGILRKNMTIQEHYRWNAYIFSTGFVPAPKAWMREKKRSSDYMLRIHGNLTTFEGLFEYRRMMAEAKGTNENDEDVIKYDYQLMDEAWCFLHENGFRVFVPEDGR